MYGVEKHMDGKHPAEKVIEHTLLGEALKYTCGLSMSSLKGIL